MESIKEVLDFLEGVDSTRVSLFLLKRYKNYKKRTITYTLYQTTIFDDLRQEFIKTANSQMSKLKEKAETRDYIGIVASDQLVVQKIKCADVPYFTEIADELRSGDLELATNTKPGTIWAYVVQMQKPPLLLYLFKKYPSKSLHVKRTILAADGELRLAKERIITIFADFDAAVLSEATEPFTKPLLVLNTTRFESLFSYFDYYQNEIEQSRDNKLLTGFLQSSDVFVDDCEHDPRKLKKMCKIIDEATLNNMTEDKLKKVVNDYGLQLKFTEEEGKLVSDEKNTWQILKLLDDDYVKSACTDIQYEARSKVKL